VAPALIAFSAARLPMARMRSSTWTAAVFHVPATICGVIASKYHRWSSRAASCETRIAPVPCPNATQI